MLPTPVSRHARFYRYLFFTLALVLGLLLLYQVRTLMTPILSALLVAYIMYPIITSAAKWGVRRGVSIAMLFAAIFSTLTYSGIVLLPALHSQTNALVRGLFEYIPEEDKSTLPIPSPARGRGPETLGAGEAVTDGELDAVLAEKVVMDHTEMQEFLPNESPTSQPDGKAASTKRRWQRRLVNASLTRLAVQISERLHSFGMLKDPLEAENMVDKVARVIGQHLILPILKEWGAVVGQLTTYAKDFVQFNFIFWIVLAFALSDGRKIYHGIISLIPNSVFEPGIYILAKTSEMFGYYLRGLVVETAILAIISFLTLLPFCLISELTVMLSLVMAIIIAVTNIVRVIGPIFGGVISLLIVVVSSTDFIAMTGVLSMVAIVQLMDNTLVLPLVMKDQVNVHPAFCVIGVIGGGIVGGVMGMVLAIPVMGGMRVVYRILTVDMKKFNMDPEPRGKLLILPRIAEGPQ